MKRHSMFLMEPADERSDLGPQDFLHWNGLGTNDVHFDIPGTQRGCYFEADETRTNHHCALCRQSLGDQRAAVSQSAQIVHVRKVSAGYREAHRLGSGGKQERVIGITAATLEPYIATCCVDRRDTRAQAHIDCVLFVEFCRAEQIRLLGRGAGQIALRQIGAVTGRRRISTQHRDAAGVALTTERFRGGIGGRATAHDHH